MKCVEVYKELYHQEPFDVAFCPYRISPLGAHIDHQYGKINGLAIDKGIHMAYHPKQNGVVELQSLNFPKRAQFFVNAVPEEKQGDWADHLRGAAMNGIIIIKYTQEGVMAVSYNRLWKLLVDRKMSKADLRKASGVAPNTMTKLRRDEEVTLTVLGKICSTLNVDYGDIMEYIDERDDEEHDPGRKGASCD